MVMNNDEGKENENLICPHSSALMNRKNYDQHMTTFF